MLLSPGTWPFKFSSRLAYCRSYTPVHITARSGPLPEMAEDWSNWK